MKWTFSMGETPLEPDEIAGLIPIHITTQNDLNEWEQNNILDAESWVIGNQLKSEKILNQTFIRQLHKRMFSKTWQWAGKYRRSDKNIGIDWRIISIHLQTIIDDTCFQLQNQSFSLDEIAVRFHHRLVYIHPFVNGNGRHARLLTDSLLLSLRQPRFSWGGNSNLAKSTHIRENYIKALRKADQYNYKLLMDFVRS